MDDLHTLIAEHRPFVRASLRHLGVVSHAVDDAEQDTFLVLVRRQHDFDPARGTSVRGWIWGICRNVAATHRRIARRHALCPASGQATRPPVEDRIAAREALDTLDPQARALWLARSEGRSAAELARACGLPLTTVQWRLRQARARVIALMQGAGHHCSALLLWLRRPSNPIVQAGVPILAACAVVHSASVPPESAAPAIPLVANAAGHEPGIPQTVCPPPTARRTDAPRATVEPLDPAVEPSERFDAAPRRVGRSRPSRGHVELGDPVLHTPPTHELKPARPVSLRAPTA